ncbi:hypothetical protein CVT24_011100 [Panaeolus cyanescens]|uniref:Oxidized purine nucleoside triphosphate hydrolase n=1 Tax=Panaeolus cyanescens TaxID=181874 RepID=A0A409YG21_9AGAR|nr:hypothetical protein CVT24_011100 [Panaeolus cyanescens]
MSQTAIPPGIDNPDVAYQVSAVKDGKVLLGYKKRGFGVGRYNGFGGKVDPGETSLEAAARELEEEAGITAALTHAGSLFFMTEGAKWAFQIEIYRADDYKGTITETDEMRPEWFKLPGDSQKQNNDLPSIPFDKMWDTDHVWLPWLFQKQKFAGRADFKTTDKDGEFVEWKWWYGTYM